MFKFIAINFFQRVSILIKLKIYFNVYIYVFYVKAYALLDALTA